jgi:hypothetical protein
MQVQIDTQAILAGPFDGFQEISVIRVFEFVDSREEKSEGLRP